MPSANSSFPMETQSCTDAAMHTIYDDEVFQMACEQFRVIADYLNIDQSDREWATYPKRAVAVTLPVHMDDGSTQAFQGYRVQHHIALGQPVVIAGIEGRREASGRGVVYLVERAMNMLKIDPGKCTAIVQGFGNVGSVAALSLAYKSGVKVVGISDHTAAIYNPKGIDVKAAEQHMWKKGNLRAFAQDYHVNPNEFLTLPCDILVPAAVDRVITGKNAAQLKCRILAEAANGPTTPDADLILDQRWDEVFVIPDILCNAGGVIVSYFEWVQGLQAFLWSESEVTDKLFRILEHSFAQVIRRAKDHRVSHRTA